MQKKASAASARVQISPISVTSTANAIHTVSDLFKLVKGEDNIMKNGDVLVYSPEQIKSATDNIGTFDKENKDIRYSMSKKRGKR